MPSHVLKSELGQEGRIVNKYIDAATNLPMIEVYWIAGPKKGTFTKMTTRLPSPGDTVAYVATEFPARADWRGWIVRADRDASPKHPMVQVYWTVGPARGTTTAVNAKRLRAVKTSFAHLDRSVGLNNK